MKKKRSSGGGANWMDTYGDMVTLLLCFFVLLYSMSTISAEQFKMLVQTFNPSGIPTQIEEVEGGNGPSAEGDQAGVIPGTDVEGNGVITQAQVEQDMEELYEAVMTFVAQAGATESVSVSKDGGKVYVSFSGTAFFQGNSDALTPQALPVLDSMAEMLSRVARSVDEIKVTGHTAQYSPGQPNDPWTDYQLSSCRAARVVAYIINHSRNEVLDPAKFRSEGAGQWQPVATNDTEEGKAQNRRVEMVISGRDLEKELGGSGSMESYVTTE